MTLFTEKEQSAIESLPLNVRQTLVDYPSVAENFLRAKDLPSFPINTPLSAFEVYYDCEDSHSICIENGVIVSNDKEINLSPKVIEIMGPDDFVFIQVDGVTICDRLNGNAPLVTGIQVGI